MSDINKILNLLQKVKKTGKSSWIACCPAHADKSPSLAIRDLEDGRLLLHCFGGCTSSEVLNSLELTFSDVMPENVGYIKKKGERRSFNPMDVLHCLRNDLQLALIIIASYPAGVGIPEDDRAVLAAIGGRVTSAIRLTGDK